MIGVIAPYLSKFHRNYQSNDIIDRLNYQYTALIIALTAFTLAATQYVGKPIQVSLYTETYCFIKGSYYMPLESEIPHEYSQRDESVIGYYQWVPIVLALQAFLFYFPSIVWRTMNSHTGRPVLVFYSSNSLLSRNFQTFYGVYLIVLYLFTKLLYVINVILQFVILNAFLGPQYTLWGAGILSDIWRGKEWSESGHFPRVTMCDFHIRVLGNIHRWTVQCVLMINMFNEKVYIFLWWWFVLVGTLSVLSLLYYVFALMLGSNQRQFVTRYLRCAGAISDFRDAKTEKYLHDFVRRFLRPDGIFILRLIEVSYQFNSMHFSHEIINVMFGHYRARMEEQSETMAVTDRAHLNGNDNLLER
ncbi:unnamed protein product [Brugia pahangi]|uniref:Innexin n=1 Tax=Brugia pahangi TaxID=6280 RepID=A0A0N4TIG9_BRUPA|nr:unnamed protein product [Brugia pahangi]